MHLDRIVAVTLGASLVSGAAIPGGNTLLFGDITWTGTVKEREHTLHGDVDCILRQIRSIDTDYKGNNTTPDARTLEKRTSTLICGNYVTASGNTIGSGAEGLIKDLALLGGTCAVPAGQHLTALAKSAPDRANAALYVAKINGDVFGTVAIVSPTSPCRMPRARAYTEL